MSILNSTVPLKNTASRIKIKAFIRAFCMAPSKKNSHSIGTFPKSPKPLLQTSNRSCAVSSKPPSIRFSKWIACPTAPPATKQPSLSKSSVPALTPALSMRFYAIPSAKRRLCAPNCRPCPAFPAPVSAIASRFGSAKNGNPITAKAPLNRLPTASKAFRRT